MRPLLRADLVVFDCDSTLSAIEGIDELARGARAEVAALTDAAMRGELPLESVYGRRLELIRPSRADVEKLAAQYVERIVPDAHATIAALHAGGVEVRVMSGGLRPAVLAVARALGVADARVAAVDIRFDGDAYAGFDDASPLARSGGKRELMREWRADVNGRIVMVGDGATDLETYDVADVFVAYAGVIARDAVVAGADVVVSSTSLAPVVPIALGGERPDGAAREVFDRGLALLDSDVMARLGNLNG